MRIKELKHTGTMVSSLGLGCMRFPKKRAGSEKIDFKKAQEIVDYAYSHGVNYYDTAYVYHGGQSEEFIGQALKKYPRESYCLTTKMPIWCVKQEEDLERIFNEQLERAGVDYFDFYLCHSVKKENWDAYVKFHTFEFLSKKRDEGKLRYIGFSFHDTPELLETVCHTYPWDFAQLQLNYLDWELQDAKTQYEILQKHDIPCIVMEPVRGGALADLCEVSNGILRQAEPNRSIASWALRYAASLPNVLVVLSGMSNMEQIADNIDTFTNFKPLTQQDYAVIDRALDAYKKKDTVPCTGCRYCMDCPQGVDIPYMFSIYNKYAIDKNLSDLQAMYKKETGTADKCIGCGACTKHCPQSIDIPQMLQKIVEIAE